MKITLEIDEAVVHRYARAARAARMAFQVKLPTTEQMMALVLSDRPPSPVVLERDQRRRAAKRARVRRRDADEC